MKKYFKIAFTFGIAGMLFACGGKKVVEPALKPVQNDGFVVMEKMIWASAPVRPDWTLNEPETQGPNMFFVGLSEKHATEKGSREAARRNAAQAVVSYLGTAVKDQFQEISTRFGLASGISNPTNASRGFVDILSAGVSKRMKPRKWYIEKYQTKMGDYYFKTYTLAAVPKNVIEEAFRETVNGEKDKLKNKIAKENNNKAKAQMMDALKAFENMKVPALGQ